MVGGKRSDENKPALSSQKSVRDLIRQFSEKKPKLDGSDQSDILSLSVPRMAARYGYILLYLDGCDALGELGFVQTSRAKNWDQINTIHEDAALKSTGVLDKSAPIGSAESGKVLSSHSILPNYFAEVDSERERLKANGEKYPLPDNVYPLPDSMRDLNGNRQYVTFERQTLAAIEARIAAGYYSIIETGIREGSGVHFRRIADHTGGIFEIEYDPAKFSDLTFTTGSPLGVSARKLLRQTSSTTERLRVVRDRVKGPDGVYTDEVVRTYPSFKTLDSLIAQNPDSSIILHRVGHDVPYVLCSADGKPIKGDVDLQDALVPDDLPLMGYECINLEKTHTVSDLIELIKTYKKQLDAAKKENPADAVRYIAIQAYLDRAIANLELIKGQRSEIASFNFLTGGVTSGTTLSPDEIIIKEFGVVKLLDVILLCAKQDGVLHGCDAYSPVKPENILVTHIPDPNNQGKFLVTHGEFEYLHLLFTNPNICLNKLKDFNPCHLIVDNRLGWREDKKDIKRCPEDGLVHAYPNKTDEEDCVKMQRLLMERQLLQCRLNFTPERYAEYLRTLCSNYDIQVQMIKLKGKDKEALKASLLEGRVVVEAIMAKVAKCDDITGRLAEIKATMAPDTYLTVKAKLKEISLDYYKVVADGLSPD